MKLSEVFNQLTSGEFSQLHLGGAVQGEIPPEKYNTVVDHINLGLTTLYTRFYLKEGRVNLSLIAGRLVYPIHPRYAVSNLASLEPVKYILDSEDVPFIEDILKIEAVNTTEGKEIPLNDLSEKYSVVTPSQTVLRVPSSIANQVSDLPECYKTTGFEVVYRAKHPKVVIPDGATPDSVEIELPETHLNALLLFVASRAYTPTGVTNEFNAGNNYASKFEIECTSLSVNNYQIDRAESTNRLIQNGWV